MKRQIWADASLWPDQHQASGQRQREQRRPAEGQPPGVVGRGLGAQGPGSDPSEPGLAPCSPGPAAAPEVPGPTLVTHLGTRQGPASQGQRELPQGTSKAQRLQKEGKLCAERKSPRGNHRALFCLSLFLCQPAGLVILSLSPPSLTFFFFFLL